MAAISKSTDSMGRLIDGLLAFSRTGRTAIRPSQFNMTELVNEVREEISAEAPGRNISWEIQPLPGVSGDRGLLKEVWVNLLSNAVKYTRPRDPAIIKIGCVERGGEWEFYVADNGVGFDMEYAGKLFGVFQRLHSESEFEGTGIGLANVSRTILRHGGRVWAKGEVDAGTTLYFSLPVVHPAIST